MSNYDTLVISGGGTKCFTSLGYIAGLRMRGYLDNVKTISCVSAGAYIATCIAMNMKASECIELMDNNISLNYDQMLQIVTTYGVCPISNFSTKWVSKVQNFMGSKDVTLLEFYEKTGYTIFIETANITTSQQNFFSWVTHPNVSLFDAVHASSSIPFIFTPVIIDGESHVDGGIINNLPLKPVLGNKCIALDICSNDNETDKYPFVTYMKKVLRCGVNVRKDEMKKQMVNDFKYIKIYSNLGVLDFHLKFSDYMNEILYGLNLFNEQRDQFDK